MYAFKICYPGFIYIAHNQICSILQLAVLATYVGDEFLALYHCIRSLAVKDPFPDAWNNLILLFERVSLKFMSHLFFHYFFVSFPLFILYTCYHQQIVVLPFVFLWEFTVGLVVFQNRSSHLHYLSSEVCFDFLRPSEISVWTEAQSTNDFSNSKPLKAEDEGSRETRLWSLIIRTISFFFIKSRYSLKHILLLPNNFRVPF